LFHVPYPSGLVLLLSWKREFSRADYGSTDYPMILVYFKLSLILCHISIYCENRYLQISTGGGQLFGKQTAPNG
jgi:hypothetical protein